MRTLTVFNHVSLDGYFVDGRGDMSFAHQQDDEWDAFVAENASGGDQPIVLGRGRTMFDDIHERVSLTLVGTRVFGNGHVVLSYTGPR